MGRLSIKSKIFKEYHQKRIDEKKLVAQKLKEEQKKEFERQQIEEIVRRYKSDWRSELNEMMTTNGIVVTYLAPEGQVDLSTATPTFTFTGSDPSGFHADSKFFGGERIRYDTVVVRVNSASSDWSLHPEGQGFDPDEYAYGIASGGEGSQTVVIPFDERLTGLFYMARDDGNVTFTTTFQRRSSVNVFVPLDDPEATSFIRGGLGGDKERRNRLKDQLEASNEWMNKLGLEPSKTSPGDIILASADALNTPGGVQGGLDKNYTYDPHMKTWVPNISDVERRAAGRQSKFRIDNPLK